MATTAPTIETDKLDAKIIKTLLADEVQQQVSVMVLSSVSSTNDIGLRTDQPLPLLCCAEQQRQGRGQHQRRWHSPSANNIYCSYTFSCQQSANLPLLSLGIGGLVTRYLQQQFDVELLLKWPNDIYYQQQKLAGILIESTSNRVVVGIGINVNMLYNNDIEQPWTSLQQLTGLIIDRNTIIAAMVNDLYSLTVGNTDANVKKLLEDWMRYDYFNQRQVKAVLADKTIIGTGCGIDSLGRYLIKTDTNHLIPIATGQIRLIESL